MKFTAIFQRTGGQINGAEGVQEIRRKHSPAFKAKLEFGVLADDKILEKLTERVAEVFGKLAESETPPVDLQALHQKIDRFTVESDDRECR